jgi:membrane associated rhomboid family serine protease
MEQMNYALYYGALFETLDELRIKYSHFNAEQEIPIYFNNKVPSEHIFIVSHNQQITVNATKGLVEQGIDVSITKLLQQKLSLQHQHKNYETSFYRKMEVWGYTTDAAGNYTQTLKTSKANIAKHVLTLKMPNAITIIIIALNVLVFLAMAIVTEGSSFMSPTTTLVGNWGGSQIDLCYEGNQWWRLFTCTFLHFGFIHLVLNMSSLYDIGSTVERIYGKLLYTIAYITCGVAASIASICWNGGPTAAGASGAIFGVLGMYLGLTLTNFFPKEHRKNIIKSLGSFIVINTILTISIPAIDIVAHMGGLVTGIIISLITYVVIRKKQLRNGNAICVASMIILLACISMVWLRPRIAVHRQMVAVKQRVIDAADKLGNQPINDFYLEKIEKEFVPTVDAALKQMPTPKFYLGGKYVKAITERLNNFKMLVVYEVRSKLFPDRKDYLDTFEHYKKALGQ